MPAFQGSLTDAGAWTAPQTDEAASTAKTSASSTTPGMTLYEVEPGTSSAISVADLHQDGLGDCFLIASIGELALTDPSAIQNMITQNSNGTETVTLHVASTGKLAGLDYTGKWATVNEVVTNSFDPNSVNSAAGQDVVNGVKEIWPQVIEKAVAQLYGGYQNIENGGYVPLAMQALTGQTATWLSLPGQSLTAAALTGDIKASDMITFDTGAKPTGYGLVGGHAYMFESYNASNGTVTLGNPWGVDQPSAIPLSKIASNFAEIDIGHHG
jgi:hypothetical protein